MKSVYCYMLAGLMLSASSCSSWLSEDDAPVMSYDYYETEAGVNAAITATGTENAAARRRPFRDIFQKSAVLCLTELIYKQRLQAFHIKT